MRISPEVAHRLGYYVYLYVHPRSGRPFDVGKGRGARCLSHISETGPSRKVRTLRSLRRAGLEPRIEILSHGLPDDTTAFRVEAAVIDALGLGRLTNLVQGRHSLQFGRMPLRDLIIYYQARPVAVRHRALLIRINELYYH